MNFTELKVELTARGFDYLTDTRQGYFINRSYQEICEEEDWPFLNDYAEVLPGATIADLRTVAAVVNNTQKTRLTPLDRRHVLEEDWDTDTIGTPRYYYVDSAIVWTYPISTTDTLGVYYWHIPPELTGTDTPESPTRFHHVICDGAAVYAYLDSDNPEMAREMAALRNEGVGRMRDSLLVRQHDRPDDFITVTGSEDW